jgi:hypothetical protein
MSIINPRLNSKLESLNSTHTVSISDYCNTEITTDLLKFVKTMYTFRALSFLKNLLFASDLYQIPTQAVLKQLRAQYVQPAAILISRTTVHAS